MAITQIVVHGSPDFDDRIVLPYAKKDAADRSQAKAIYAGKVMVARGERTVSGLRFASELQILQFSSDHRRLTWRSGLPTSIWIRAIDGHFATQRWTFRRVER